VDVREHLVSLHDNSTQDLIDFSHDIPPASLRFDHIHLNTAGYTKVAEFLNSKLGILLNQNSFLQAKDIDYYAITPFSSVSTNYIPYLSNSGKSVTNSNIYYTGADVGIGTTTPGAKLDVNGGIRVADNGQLAFGWGFAGVTGSSSTQSVGLFSWNGAGTTERLRATNSGAILINTFSDNLTDILQVNGSVSANALKLTTTPTASAGSYLFLTYNATTNEVEQTSTVPTQAVGTNNGTIANTAFVQTSTASVASAVYGSEVSLSSGQSPYTLLLSDSNARITTNGTFNQNFSVIVPDNATVPFQIGTKIRINCSSAEAGFLDLSGPGITFTGISSLIYRIRHGSSFEITKIATDTWYVDELSLWSTNSAGNIVQNTDKQVEGNFIGSFGGSLGNSKFPVYTVATLPTTPPNAAAGNWAYVTDATSPTYLGTLTGGGSVVCPVFYNGTSWVAH